MGYLSIKRRKYGIEVVEKYQGVFPRDKKALLALPGIGPYTAGAILSIAYGEPTPAIDGNVFRVVMRTLASDRDISDDKTRRDLDALLTEIYPTGEEASLFTEALMELGENVCIPNGEPRCDLCPIAHLCRAHEGKIETFFPVKSPKKPRRIEPRTLLMYSYRDTVYIRKRPAHGLLASLYEFVGVDGQKTAEEVVEYLSSLGLNDFTLIPLEDGKHIFTHIEWHMKAYIICLATPLEESLVRRESLLTATLSELRDKYSIPTAFKMFLNQIERKLK